jgi:hypothetical protein
VNKFKVGDRIVMYNYGLREKGFIHAIHDDAQMDVDFGEVGLFYNVSPKQCRKLVKKPKSYFIIQKCEYCISQELCIVRTHSLDSAIPRQCSYCNMIKVREVK